MKHLVIIIIALITLGNTNVFAQKKSKSYDKATVKVEGLGCPFCAFGLEKKFKEIKGIKNITIDMESGVMKFKAPESLALSVSAIDKQVTKAGYTAVDVIVNRANGEVDKSSVSPVATVAPVGKMETVTFEVSGNCGMCKARIEKTAKAVTGVKSAVWDVETKVLTLEYSIEQTKAAIVKTAIAKVGHDVGEFKATKEVYSSLPPCCLYDRD